MAQAAGDCVSDVLASTLVQVRKCSMENIVQDTHALELGLIDVVGSTAELCHDAKCIQRCHAKFLPIPEFKHDLVLIITSDSLHLSYVKDNITLCVLFGL